MENRLKISHCPGTLEGGSTNDHSPLERGQYASFRASFPLLLLWFCQCSCFYPWFFADFVKVKKFAVLYIKHTCTRTINLQCFLQDTLVVYQEKRTNIATENHFIYFFFYFFFFFFFYLFIYFFFFFVILNYMHFMATF